MYISGKTQLRILTISTTYAARHAPPMVQTHAFATPSMPRIQPPRAAMTNSSVNLKMLLAAPSGQIYLHQNIFTTKPPNSNSVRLVSDIQSTISPLNPVATA